MITLEMPAHAVAVRSGNLDSDPQQELVVESRIPDGDRPDRVLLTILHFNSDGSLSSKRSVALGNRPCYWDLQNGLYLMDADGLAQVDSQTGALSRLVSLSTPLAGLGATTPAFAPLAHDLDNDGQVELVIWAMGRYQVFKSDGSSLGGVQASAEGALQRRDHAGGSAMYNSTQPPMLAIADLDGDGKKDLLLPSHSHLQVAYGGASWGSRGASINLPLDLEPRPEPPVPGQIRKEIAGSWFRDLDGDGKADLAVYRLVYGSSFFGATAELQWWKGTGTSFTAGQTLSPGSAAFGVELVDMEGDGDLDWLVPAVDIGMGNLGRALVSKAVRVDLRLYRMGSGSYGAAETLRSLSFPIEQEGRFQADYTHDHTGDKTIDLLSNEGQDRVLLYPGGSTTAALDVAVTVPLGENTLLGADLTGNGQSDIFLWGPELSTATLIVR